MTTSTRINDLPESERPREKLTERGASALSDAELLALFFGSGLPGLSAIELGRKLLDHFGSLRGLAGAGVEELTSIKGIGPAKSTQLAAVFEFGKRLARERIVDRPIDSPEAVFELVGSELAPLRHESLRAILLNTRHRLIRVVEVSHGSLNESVAHPREILREAIVHSAFAFILTHNHPSGDPAPSEADRKLTRRLSSVAREIGIEMLDHVIIGATPEDGGDPYFSFAEMGLL